MIKERYCSYEVARLLQEKGFDEECILLFYLCFTLTKGLLRPILITIDSAVIYPILTICLMKLSFKIGDKLYKKKRK